MPPLEKNTTLGSGAIKDVYDTNPAYGVLELYGMKQSTHMTDNFKASVSKSK